MRALCIDDRGLGLRDVAPCVPEPGEALLRVRMAGICNTDLEIARGYMGFRGVLGHEFCADVLEHPDPALVGRRVAGEINLGCGGCPSCVTGGGRHCPERRVLGILAKDGCFAERVTLPARNLHLLPDTLSDELACFVEPTAAAFEILEQGLVEPDQEVVVLGDGKLGLLIGLVLASAGARPVLVGRHAHKLERARRGGLATASLDALPRYRYPVVVEATGSPEGLQDALALVQPRGTLVLKSTYHGTVSLDAAPIVIDEIHLVGSRCGPFEPAIEALCSGAVDPSPLIDAVVPFARAEEAFERARSPGTLKVLLDSRSP